MVSVVRLLYLDACSCKTQGKYTAVAHDTKVGGRGYGDTVVIVGRVLDGIRVEPPCAELEHGSHIIIVLLWRGREEERGRGPVKKKTKIPPRRVRKQHETSPSCYGQNLVQDASNTPGRTNCPGIIVLYRSIKPPQWHRRGRGVSRLMSMARMNASAVSPRFGCRSKPFLLRSRSSCAITCWRGNLVTDYDISITSLPPRPARLVKTPTTYLITHLGTSFMCHDHDA